MKQLWKELYYAFASIILILTLMFVPFMCGFIVAGTYEWFFKGMFIGMVVLEIIVLMTTIHDLIELMIKDKK